MFSDQAYLCVASIVPSISEEKTKLGDSKVIASKMMEMFFNSRFMVFVL